MLSYQISMETIFLGYLGNSLKNIPKTFRFLTSLYLVGKIVRVPFCQYFNKLSHFCFNFAEI